jgi:hypothetical protein
VRRVADEENVVESGQAEQAGDAPVHAGEHESAALGQRIVVRADDAAERSGIQETDIGQIQAEESASRGKVAVQHRPQWGARRHVQLAGDFDARAKVIKANRLDRHEFAQEGRIDMRSC